MVFFALSCEIYKRQNDKKTPREAGRETPQYQQPLEEKNLLSASGKNQTNGFAQSDGMTSILFASEYVYEKQSYTVLP